MFQRTTAQAKIARLDKRVRIVQGGTSSSKTFSIIPLLIQYAKDNPTTEVSIVSESIPHLRRGAIRDFLKILEMTGNLHISWWNKSTLTYTLPNGSFIEFFSADQSDKLRGARRDVLFINEANNIGWEAYHQMAIRTRKFIYIDYNPTQEFWAHTELIPQPNVDFIKLTYRDNEALEPAIVKEIEKAKERAKDSPYWANWWSVYGLGEVGSLQGVVFSNWDIVDSMPDGKWKAYGIDFGFTNDPTACVEVVYSDGELYIREMLYQTGQTSDDLNQSLSDIKRQEMIGDSADPKTIEELRRRGFRIRGAVKGQDSIRAGIDLMQGLKMHVTKDSVNLIKELRGYVWETDKTGKHTGKPIDRLNHCIDAVRYCVMAKLKHTGKYSVL
jgi:phage terminase large subunit